MLVAGRQFRLVNTRPISSVPGIYIYIHQATGKCFVKGMRNSRMQIGKHNYPPQLKDLLKTNKSEVLLYLTDLEKDTKEVIYGTAIEIRKELHSRGSLFVNPLKRDGSVKGVIQDLNILHTVWVMKHLKTGALFYFEAVKGEDVTKSITQRMLTFNNYVMKKIANENRVMYEFAKENFPLDISHWFIRDLDLAFVEVSDAVRHITKTCKKHMGQGEIVLNRISNTDALYYRNSILKLPHVSMGDYLKCLA